MKAEVTSMLRFNKIEMENFGTYKDVKEISFTDKDGVTIIWGNNGLGKTTLLNAFKYVLFGKIVNRENAKTPKKELINWESFKNGIYSFRVSLDFSVDGDNYLLNRSYSLISPSLDPNEDKSYRDTVSLKKNGSILSPTECGHIINSIMPEQVSRFFLFDGELLKEYEELIHEEKGIGQKIKTSIEEILGVPILTNAYTDTDVLASDYLSQLTAAAQKDTEYQELGKAIVRAKTEKEEYEKQLAELKSEREKITSNIDKLEVDRAKNDKVRELVDEISKLKSLISRCEQIVNDKKLKICDYSDSLWKRALSKTIESTLEELNDKKTQLEDKQKRYDASEQLLNEMRESCNNSRCIICGTDLAGQLLKEMQDKIASYQSHYSSLSEEELAEYDRIKSDISKLNASKIDNNVEVLEIYESDINDALVDKADAEHKIKEIEKDIIDYSKQKKEIEEITCELEKNNLLLANINSAIASLETQIEEAKENISKATQKLSSGDSAKDEFRIAQEKSQFCTALSSLMNEGLDTYRQYLKEQVQEDATTIFLNLSSNKEYTALEINDNYGLNIVHETGQIISIRSAGFEHIVALSLIGALHQNAPLQGPIVMDSPFGRLDSTHESNVIKYLPKLANQVMLLVFDREIDEQNARINLGSDLLQELILVYGGTFDTEIRRH